MKPSSVARLEALRGEFSDDLALSWSVIGVCLGSVIVLLIASGVGAALHGRGRDEGSA